MKITALEEYGLRCLVRLALAQDGGPLTVAEIAEQEGLTVPYVGKLMSHLRRRGLVDSVRGRGGGYTLTRPAGQISVEEVLSSLGEPLFSSQYCDSHPGALSVCTHQVDCSIRSIWQTLGEVIQRVLRGTSLADLRLREQILAGRFRDDLEASSLLPLAAHGCPTCTSATSTAAAASGAADRLGEGSGERS